MYSADSERIVDLLYTVNTWLDLFGLHLVMTEEKSSTFSTLKKLHFKFHTAYTEAAFCPCTLQSPMIRTNEISEMRMPLTWFSRQNDPKKFSPEVCHIQITFATCTGCHVVQRCFKWFQRCPGTTQAFARQQYNYPWKRFALGVPLPWQMSANPFGIARARGLHGKQRQDSSWSACQSRALARAIIFQAIICIWSH